jgi:hypothetical protein
VESVVADTIARRQSVVLHPFLLAVYPILFLVAHNIAQFAVWEAFPPICYALGIALFLFVVLQLLLRDRERVGVVVSLLAVCFYAYGHLFELVDDVRIGPLNFGRQSVMCLAWLGVFAVVITLVVRTRKSLHGVTNLLNVMGLALVVLSLFTIVTRSIGGSDADPKKGTATSDTNRAMITPVADAAATSLDSLPDIYYIILDGHASQRTLQKVYNYDNAKFIDHLRSRGFFVADQSHSNYPHTVLSLASSLNMKYLDDLAATMRDGNVPAVKMIRNNEVAGFLKRQGYRHLHFATGWDATNSSDVADEVVNSNDVREFQALLYETTLLRAFTQDALRERARQSKISILHRLMGMHRGPKPQFVFAHVLLPHPPFIFGAHGEEHGAPSLQLGRYSEWKDREGYVGQLAFVDSLVGRVVDSLLTNVKPRPVIIVQGDHGPASYDQWEQPTDEFVNERFGILNAIYIPDARGAGVLDWLRRTNGAVTPVNTFRVILNSYFGGEFPVLPDRSFISRPEENLVLSEVTDRLERWGITDSTGTANPLRDGTRKVIAATMK